MKKILFSTVLLCLLSVIAGAGSTCPELAGKFSGPCTETYNGSTRTFNWNFSIEQNSCSKIKVSGWMLSSNRDIGVQFIGPDNFGKGPSYRATASYFFDSLMYYEIFGEDPIKPREIAVQTFKKISPDAVESLYESSDFISGKKLTMTCIGYRTP